MTCKIFSMLKLLALFLVSSSLEAAPCICGRPCECKPLRDKMILLSLDDGSLYNQGLSGVGQCKISRNTGTSFCDLYVTSGINGVSGDKGYPLNKDCKGTGCVKAPDFPKAITICWYSAEEYSPSVQLRAPDYCTNSGVVNAATQLRDAIREDACDCKAKGTQKPSPSPPSRPYLSPKPILASTPNSREIIPIMSYYFQTGSFP